MNAVSEKEAINNVKNEETINENEDIKQQQ